MKIKFLAHALKRLAERGIDKELVEEAILHSDQIILEEGRKIIHKKYLDKQKGRAYLLRIFLDERGGQKRILTVYKTSKIDKYWKKEVK